MEYVYAALLVHKLGQAITEASIRKVVESAGGKPDDGRIKALVASLEGVDIEKAIKEAAMPAAAPAVVAGPAAPAKDEKKKEEEEKKSEEQAAAGLGALFG